jgi:hypothetical protein
MPFRYGILEVPAIREQLPRDGPKTNKVVNSVQFENEQELCTE